MVRLKAAAEPRNDHQRLYGVVKPVDDPFWDTWLPPSDWGCRCSVKQVRDDDNAKEVPKDIKLPPAYMRQNPYKTGELFSDKHPMIAKLSDKERKMVDKAIGELTGETKVASPQENDIITREVKTVDDLREVMQNLDDKFKGKYFARGFKDIKLLTDYTLNGTTDMEGTIELHPNIYQGVIKALNNIRAGIDTTYEDEKALSTLWHEITHNKNVVGNMPVTSLQLQFYELANEFVSRNTLPEFMYSLGGKLNHTELMDTRDNTAYNEKVKNYGYLITRVNGNKEKVLEGVIDYVLNFRKLCLPCLQ